MPRFVESFYSLSILHMENLIGLINTECEKFISREKGEASCGLPLLCRCTISSCLFGPVEYFMFIGHKCFRTATDISERECSKKFVQQGRSPFDARSVLPVREHGKRARTPLAAFFNIPSFYVPWAADVWKRHPSTSLRRHAAATEKT